MYKCFELHSLNVCSVCECYRNLHDALSGHTSGSVSEAVKYSEKAKTKCIGITIETRPDYCLQRHMSDMLNYGCTR